MPTWAAERRGELILRPCPDCEGTSVSLYGRGVAEVIDAVPRYLGFGEVPPGERKTLTVRLSNFGDASTSLVSAALLHAPGMPFELGAITLPRSLEPNESLELAVTFAPAHVVEATGTLRLQAGASVVDVELAGRCLPVLLAAAPASLDFGAVSKGTSTTRTVLIHRLGQQAATVTSLAIEGAGVFTATNGRELPAEVGEPLEVAVVFAPTADGPLASELVVRSDPGPQMLRVPLSGRGFDGPPCELAIVPNALRFGLVPTGEVRRREVLIENVGATACPIWDLARDPSGDSDFMLVEPASTEALLAAGESLRAVIEFTPAEPRLVPQGTALTFSAHPASRPPVRVPITGHGTALRVLADPDPLDFGRVPIGGRALRSLDVRNEGERMVRIEAIELAGGDSAAFGLEFLPPVGYSLAPGAAFSVPAIFTPAATGRHRAELAIWIEDQGEPVLAGFVGEGVEEPCGEACRPQASCPGDRIVHIHEAVELRGAGIDADGGPLTCAWAVVAAPVGSAPEIEVLDGCVARFRPDVVGRYRVELSVSDGTGERSACDLTVEAVPLPPLWIETVWSGDDDVDVHLFHPGAGDPGTAAAWFHPVYDCHFSNLAPYWDGASRDDDPFLDRDDRTGRGPEIVYIGSPNTEHDYVVGAHWFQSANGNPSQVVRTRIYCGGVLVAELETALEGPGLATVIGAIRYTSTETCTFTPDGRVLGVDP